jgi:carbon-monoxide dehydrogenase medium subunit
MPVRLSAIEAELAGKALKAEALEGLRAQVEAATDARSDYRASAEYRRAMAGVLVRRVVERVAGDG